MDDCIPHEEFINYVPPPENPFKTVTFPTARAHANIGIKGCHYWEFHWTDKRRVKAWARPPRENFASAIEAVCKFTWSEDSGRIVRFEPECVAAGVAVEEEDEPAAEDDADQAAAIPLATSEHQGWRVFWKGQSPEKQPFAPYRARLQAKLKTVGTGIDTAVASRTRPPAFKFAAQKRSAEKMDARQVRVRQALKKARDGGAA